MACVQRHPCCSKLADKGAILKNHFYWSMENAQGSEEKLRTNLESCITHFQNDQSKCDSQSKCWSELYVPSFIIVKSQLAISSSKTFVQSHVVSKSAKDFIYARDTGYVKSCNNSALMYLDKRIHYTDMTYKTPQSLLDFRLEWACGQALHFMQIIHYSST